MGMLVLILLCLFATKPSGSKTMGDKEEGVIKVKGGPASVMWIVQLSDLHFSVHHPERATDFKKIVGPTLHMINPSLVLITGDLTDGKSKDLLTMKQNEKEWVEYRDIMEDVVKRSGLRKSVFYDLRGNHDNFGVPTVGGSCDYFSNYSINGQLGRRGNVNSVTIEMYDQKHLFVGLDTTMSTGVRGPTNLFGHPTDDLLTRLDLILSQRDSQVQPVTKIAFGHFPLSFSAYSQSQKGLKDIFLKHSISAYLCGHLHTGFGKNLKRHHFSIGKNHRSSQELIQMNMHQMGMKSGVNCSFAARELAEFWEWEMGDWRKSRAMRIIAIDRGHVSYLDIDFKSGAKKTIIMPTFPLDSRFMSKSSFHRKYECQHMVPLSFETVRALVFSTSPIVSVELKIYDSRPGTFSIVLETLMVQVSGDDKSRGDLYAASWNYKAFEDPSPDRYWLQIEAIDVMGRSTLSELRPFSINGLTARVSWTWKEFFVMGCQWANLYYPIFWCSIYLTIIIFVIPKFVQIVLKKQYSYKSFIAKEQFLYGTFWVLQEITRFPAFWFGFFGYTLYLIVCPWFIGHIFDDGSRTGYMTYMGWVAKFQNGTSVNHQYFGSPDIMVIVLPHIFFVVWPAIVVAGALIIERSICKERILSYSGKKEDDNNKRSQVEDLRGSKKFYFRWIRKVLFLACLVICWKHFRNCRALIRAYEMNPVLHFLPFAFVVPVLLGYTVYQTRFVQ